MYKTRVLIISSRKELSIKYKKLIEALGQTVIIASNLSDALDIIQKQEIEFIIISDTIKEKLSGFIQKIRILTYNFRPVIIAVSKSGDVKDRLEALDSGADDFLGEEISKQEFQTRFRAHLRRYLENSINQTTKFLERSITKKAVNRTLFENCNLSYLLIKIKNIELYQKTHGEIATEKVLQTLSAIVNSVLSQNDFIGHLSDREFILITSNDASEKIASFLAFAFDNILNKFYSNDEYENNFTIQSSDSIEESKTGLMRLNIASIEKNENSKSYTDVIQNLRDLIVLCKDENSSSYIIDRIKLKGEVTKKENNKVLILEPDCALSYLLKNVCELNNIEVKAINRYSEFKKVYKDFKPNVVVLDWGFENAKTSLNIAYNISKDNVKLIFSSSCLNKEEILKAGADLYIPKPYEIDDIVYWIKKFLN